MQVSQVPRLDPILRQQQEYRYDPTPRRTLSPKEQKAHLISSIESLMSKNSLLKEKHETLQNTISDLRKLLELVGNESLQESRQLNREKKAGEARRDELAKKLQFSQKEGNHLQRCALFWREFIE